MTTTVELIRASDIKLGVKKSRVVASKNYITLKIGYNYDIELSRCDTTEKILSWVLHLSRKNWMTGDMIHDFITTACDKHNLDITRLYNN